MFSKELENLIQATLEDGVLEENEKAALVKRAQREGVDLDELEIYINSLLQRRQRELNEKKHCRKNSMRKRKKKPLVQSALCVENKCHLSLSNVSADMNLLAKNRCPLFKSYLIKFRKSIVSLYLVREKMMK